MAHGHNSMAIINIIITIVHTSYGCGYEPMTLLLLLHFIPAITDTQSVIKYCQSVCVCVCLCVGQLFTRQSRHCDHWLHVSVCVFVCVPVSLCVCGRLFTHQSQCYGLWLHRCLNNGGFRELSAYARSSRHGFGCLLELVH